MNIECAPKRAKPKDMKLQYLFNRGNLLLFKYNNLQFYQSETSRKLFPFDRSQLSVDHLFHIRGDQLP